MAEKQDDKTPETHGELSWYEKALTLVTDVHPGEGITALLLTLNVFLVLCAYYVIKPVREALIGAVENGPQYKSYMGAGIALVLFFAVPLYSRFATRWKRNQLIMRVSLFFIANLIGFYFLGLTPLVKGQVGATIFACGFLLWVGVFNMMAVAQFWGFAADVYTEEQGKRLFSLVAVGATVGSAVGSLVVDRIVETVGTLQMMLVSAALLFIAALVTQLVQARSVKEGGAKKGADGSESAKKGEESLDADKSKDGKDGKDGKGESQAGAYGLVFRNRYLLLIAIFTMLFSLVNTSGEFMISSLVSKAAKAHSAVKEEQRTFIAAYFGSYFFWVNTICVVVQMFLVSRIVKYGGFKVGFMIYPIVALLGSAAISFLPVLLVVRIAKTAENSLDYSLNNTMRNMLWLPTTRRMKYLAKQAVDSFFARMGDVGSALGVFVLYNLLDLGVRGIAIMNTVLIGVWLYVAWRIVQEQDRMSKSGQKLDDGGSSEKGAEDKEAGPRDGTTETAHPATAG